MTDTKERLKAIIIENLDIDSEALTDTASFERELGMDSLDAMDLMLAADEAFDIRLEREEMEKIDNLAAFTQVIDAHRHEK